MQPLQKHSAESRLFDMDFSSYAELMNEGQTLSSVNSVVASPSGLTLGPAVISSTRVQFRVSGGSVGATYTISVTATTSGGDIIQGCGKLTIGSC